MLDSILGEIDKNEKKVTAIIGGKKVKSKLKLLTTLSKRVNKLIIVGGMANTFLKSQGIDIGNSFYEEDMLDIARNINNAQLPLDFIDENCEVTETLIGRAAYDIGPKSLKLIDSIISQSDIVIWNGPAGVYEDERFIIGSNEIAMSIVRHNVKAVIGGGDTVAIVNKLSLSDNIYISSGGGAFIAWLENPSLPGITHLCS
jgi:phosphoglycerate kinase